MKCQERTKIQQKIVKRLKKISKLREEVYWLARQRDKDDG
jgi:hypothetical protein